MAILTTINMKKFWKGMKEYETDVDSRVYYIHANNLADIINEAMTDQRITK